MTSRHRAEFQLAYNHLGACFAALLLVMFTAGASGQPSGAQQGTPNTAKSAGTDIEPRGKREVKDIAYGDWQKLCFKPGGAKMHCRTSITSTFATGQMAVRLDIIERDAEGISRLQVFVPVGMYLQKPVKLIVDQAPPHSIPYTWCLTNTCIAGVVASPKMIKEMSAGKTLRLEFIDSNLLSLTVSLPLSQFASIHKGAPTQIFEQDIDE